MSRKKTRTSISLPEELLGVIDSRAQALGRTRSDLVCEAVNRYFASEEERLMAEGYREMARQSGTLAASWDATAPEAWPEW